MKVTYTLILKTNEDSYTLELDANEDYIDVVVED